MSKKRQTAILDPRGEARAELTTLTYDYPPFYEIPEHFHEEAQCLFASRGVMTLRARRRGAGMHTWILPPQRALWIPARTVHSIRMSKSVSMRTLYFRLPRKMPMSCRVLQVSPLLRELILHCCERERVGRRIPGEASLIDVVLEQIARAETVPLSLPHPEDPRAARIAETLLADPSDPRGLAELSRAAGASRRTLERLFVAETGMGFGKWRQQLRLLHGIRRVAEGEKITEAALDAGYASPSAFISMFRKTLGVTPRDYFRGRGSLPLRTT